MPRFHRAGRYAVRGTAWLRVGAVVLCLLVGVPWGAMTHVGAAPPPSSAPPPLRSVSVASAGMGGSAPRPALGRNEGPLTPSAALWARLLPSIPAPSVRTSESLAYDPTDNFTLLFGGSYLNDTWKEHGGVWSNLTSTLSIAPSPRGLAPMAYDVHDGYFVLFGGFSKAPNASLGSYHNDTWIFRNGSWTNLTPTAGTPPAPRFAPEMAYDPALSAVVLFGGVIGGLNDPSHPLNDTWEFRNGTWTNLTPRLNYSPDGRDFEGLAYDPTDGYLVLYGGFNESVNRLYNDTWTFNASGWKQVFPSSNPGALRAAFFASPVGDGGYPLLYGGETGFNVGAPVSNTWEFQSGEWTNRSSQVGASPTPLELGAMIWDGSESRLLLFGGYSRTGAATNSTWLYDAELRVNGSVSPALTEVGGTAIFNLSSIGGTWEYSYAYDGLPPGCASSNTSRLSCSPSAAGNFTVTANVTDGMARRSVNLSLSAVARLTITLSVSRTSLDVGQGLAVNVTIAGGLPAYGLVRYSGTPPGCAPNATGPWACRPSLPGTYALSGSVTDGEGVTARSPQMVLNVSADPTVRSTLNRSVVDVGAPVEVGANVTPATLAARVTWSGLPAGCAARMVPFECRPQGVGNFTLLASVTDSNGFTAASVQNLTVLPNLSVAGNSRPLSGPAPFTATVSATVGGGRSPYTITWLFDDGSRGSGLSVVHTFRTVGVDREVVWANDSYGGSANSTVLVTVGPPLSAHLEVTPGDAVLDAGGNLMLHANASGGAPPYQYAWTNLPNGCTSADQATLECRPVVPGAYDVTVSVQGNAGPLVTASAMVVVDPALSLEAMAAPYAACGPTAVNFTATPHGGTAPVAITWDLGAGGTVQGPDQERAYTTAGDYTVNVRATDSAGASVSRNVTFSLVACPSGAGSSGGIAGLSPLDWVLVGVVLVAVGVAIGAYRRSRPPAPREEEPASPPGSNDGEVEIGTVERPT